jgi:hypothetical protein
MDKVILFIKKGNKKIPIREEQLFFSNWDSRFNNTEIKLVFSTKYYIKKAQLVLDQQPLEIVLQIKLAFQNYQLILLQFQHLYLVNEQ